MSTASPEITAVLSQACGAAGLDPAAAVPVRLGENAIFRLPGGVIARISRPGQQSAARREVAVSRWLNGAGIAAVTAIVGIAQPVEVGERSITFWEELPPHRHGTPAEVAGVLRRLHAQAMPVSGGRASARNWRVGSTRQPALGDSTRVPPALAPEPVASRSGREVRPQVEAWVRQHPREAELLNIGARTHLE
jgi:hypothetical protein